MREAQPVTPNRRPRASQILREWAASGREPEKEGSMRNHHSTLAGYAHRMRNAPTDSEAALWRALRASQLGVRFRRQVPLLGFIVDFYAPSVRLVVEIDGGYHVQRRSADARRDRKLRRAGFRVLRVDASAVGTELPRVLRSIVEAISEQTGA